MQDLGEQVQTISRMLGDGYFPQAAKECVTLIEHALRELLRRESARLAGRDRLKLNQAELQVGKGEKSLEEFGLGQLVGVLRTSGFLDAWSQATGRSLATVKMVNLDGLVELRNGIVHRNEQAGRSEAELLYNVLRTLLETFGILTLEEAPPPPRAVEPAAGLPQAPAPRPSAPPPGPSPLEVRTFSEDGLEYVFIPPGQYEMGASPGDDEAGDSERPRHRVRVARGFWLARTPVTVQAYRRFCDATGRLMPEAPDFNPNWQHGDHPVVNVSWDDAAAYCEWAGGRLPSEAEWEYAARAGTGTRYWWGNEFDEDKAWYEDNSDDSTHPVGRKPGNPWGLLDALGNVWEWCADPWHGDYQGAPTEAVVWRGGDEHRGVLRGGSWDTGPGFLRVSYRWFVRGIRDGYYGFRCARDV